MLAIPALLVVAAVAIATADPSKPMVSLLLGLAVGSYVLMLNSPAWALAPLLVTELSISNYIVAEVGISLRLAAVLLAITISVGVILHRLQSADPRFRRLLVVTVAFVGIVTLENLLHSQSEYVFKYFRYQLAQALALILAASVIRSRQDLKRIAMFALILGLISAGAAIWQHFDRATAIYGDGSEAILALWKGRSLGLTGSPILLANNMTFILMPVLGLVACGPMRLDRQRLLLLGAAMVLCLGFYLTYTRSTLPAVGAGILMIGLYVGGRFRFVVIGAVVGSFLLFQALQGTGLIGARYYKDSSNDTSAATHNALLDVALAIALDNPIFGIGHEQFEELSRQYSDNPSADVSAGDENLVGGERPHNDWLSVWLSWGIFALIGYVGLFVAGLVNCAIAARNRDLLIRGLSVGCAGGLVTYGVNSTFHNYLDSSVALWLYLGLSVALVLLPVSASASSRLRSRFGVRSASRTAIRSPAGR